MNELENLYKYLLDDDILSYENEIFKIIPELKYEKNFEQRSEWHCYDVWMHTVATINACEKSFENRLVMLLHDIGKPFSYQEDGEMRHFKNHATKSAEISKKILDRLNISLKPKENILKLIEMHSTEIKPECVSLDDIEFYIRLLKIQRCDAQGYEPQHSLKILERLNITENILINKLKQKKENLDTER